MRSLGLRRIHRCGIAFAIASVLPWLPRQALGSSPSSLEERIAKEERLKQVGYFILPHRPNYLMPLSYNPHPNNEPFAPETQPLDEIETKFQISVKVPLAERLFTVPIQTYIAYTQVSFWQTYNDQKSSLFRNTDYEPEFFFQSNATWKISGLTNRYSRLGFTHQSNGQATPISRSWNRIYAEFVLDYGPSMISIKPWFRIIGPAEEDTNPDMWKYYGYGELRGAVKVWGKQEFSLLFRNNLDFHDNKGAVELGWSFPLIRSMNGFVQYFNGYGESLLDYNVPVSRVSVGVSFSGWL